jgi:hypothetical protein
MTVHRRLRAGQRGQTIPIIALAGTVLLGFTALATDLSLQTHYRRTLQNVTDAAALAGVRDLGAVANQPDRVSAVSDALNTVANTLKLPAFVSTWRGGASCSGSQCDVSLTSANYAVTVNVPPKDTPTAAYRTWPYVEVEMSKTTQNGIGNIVGAATSTEGARSVGYHFAANQPFGFALYAQTLISDGNDGETVAGNVYADRSINPQASGHAGFCADTNQVTGAGSYVIFGTLQKGDNGYLNDGQYDVRPTNADVVNSGLANCSSTGSGTVNETATANAANCGSLGVQGVTLNTTFNTYIDACVASPKLSPPVLTGPSGSGGTFTCGSGALIGTQWQAGTYQCSTGSALPAGNNSFAPGVYTIVHNPACNPKSCFDLDFSRDNVQLTGVTFLLVNGATVGVEKGATVTVDPISGCVKASYVDCRYSFFDPTSASVVQVIDLGSTLTTYGTMYLANGSVHVDSNAFIFIASGQAIVNSWDVQSGFHPNPDVIYNGNNSAPQNEVLKLVE